MGDICYRLPIIFVLEFRHVNQWWFTSTKGGGMPDNKGMLTKEEMGAIALKFVRGNVLKRGLDFFNPNGNKDTIAVILGVPADVANHFIEQIQEG
mgnify:CR=1 FL=1